MMKKFVLILIVALAPAFLGAQNSAVKNLFEKYGGKKGFTTVSINGGLLKMAAALSGEDEDLDVLNSINTIKILVQEDADADNFYDEIMGDLKKDDSYEELMTVNTDEEDVVFMIKMEGEKISEFLIIVGGKDDNALIYIGGDLNMKDLAKIGKSVNLGDDFAYFDKLKELEKK